MVKIRSAALGMRDGKSEHRKILCRTIPWVTCSTMTSLEGQLGPVSSRAAPRSLKPFFGFLNVQCMCRLGTGHHPSGYVTGKKYVNKEL